MANLHCAACSPTKRFRICGYQGEETDLDKPPQINFSHSKLKDFSDLFHSFTIKKTRVIPLFPATYYSFSHSNFHLDIFIESYRDPRRLYIDNWLMVWNMNYIFHILGMSSSQVYHQPDKESLFTSGISTDFFLLNFVLSILRLSKVVKPKVVIIRQDGTKIICRPQENHR